MASFTRKRLRATLVLPGGIFSLKKAASGSSSSAASESLNIGQQYFPGTEKKQLVLENFRMKANLTWGGNWTNFLDLTIYGMRQADMNALTVLWAGPNPTQLNNHALVILEANNGDGRGWATLFVGQFQQASPDYSAIPDACMSIQASSGYGAQVAAVSPSSYPGAASVATIAQNLAKAMGFTLENNDVTAQLNNPYLSGTLMDQFRQLCDHANIDYYIESGATGGTLIICPKNQPRQRKTAVVLSASTGLIGYPIIQQFGVRVQTLFNPALRIACPIQIISDVPGANGIWFSQNGVHQLETWTPKGAWFSTFDCYPHSAYASS